MDENLFYAILPYPMAALVVLFIIYIIRNTKNRPAEEIPAHAEVVAGIGVLLATMASVTAVVMFAVSVGGSVLEKGLAVAWLLAFQAVEFTAAFMAGDAQNSRGSRVGSVSEVIARYGCCGYYSRYCSERDRIRADMTQYRDVVMKWKAYQGAQAHAQSLQAEPLPVGARESTLPWVAGIAHFTGLEPETVNCRFANLYYKLKF